VKPPKDHKVKRPNGPWIPSHQTDITRHFKKPHMTPNYLQSRAETIFALERARSEKLREALNAAPEAEGKLIWMLAFARGMEYLAEQLQQEARK